MKQTILSVKQSELLEKLIVNHGLIVTSDQTHSPRPGRVGDWRRVVIRSRANKLAAYY